MENSVNRIRDNEDYSDTRKCRLVLQIWDQYCKSLEANPTDLTDESRYDGPRYSDIIRDILDRVFGDDRQNEHVQLDEDEVRDSYLVFTTPMSHKISENYRKRLLFLNRVEMDLDFLFRGFLTVEELRNSIGDLT